MKHHSLTIGGATVSAPTTWTDVTDELELTDPPFTLADAATGVGALQFSLALHAGGPPPDDVSAADLLRMAQDSGDAHAMGAPQSRVAEDGPVRVGAASYHDGEDFTRVWYVSDGRNVAKVTYTCAWDQRRKELAVCEDIVRSLRFS